MPAGDARSRTATEGVRILGAEEAQAAMDAGTVGRRLERPGHPLRRRPAAPRSRRSGRPPGSPRPPTSRAPDVVPEADAGDADERRRRAARRGHLPARRSRARPSRGAPADRDPPRRRARGRRRGRRRSTTLEPIALDVRRAEDDSSPIDLLARGRRRARRRRSTTTTRSDDVDVAAEAEAEPRAPVRTLPHWSEPPTGEIPLLLPEAEPVDLTGEETSTPTPPPRAPPAVPASCTGVGRLGPGRLRVDRRARRRRRRTSARSPARPRTTTPRSTARSRPAARSGPSAVPASRRRGAVGAAAAARPPRRSARRGPSRPEDGMAGRRPPT